MIKPFIYLYFWVLDYLYALKEIISGLFDHTSSARYKTQGGEAIVLIPGIYENWKFMRPIASLLHSNGYDVHIVDGLGYNVGTVEEMATVVEKYILEHSLSDATLVTHSKGGLVGKYLLSTFKKEGLVKGMVALNSPFSGSRYAYVMPLRSLRIFIPNSKVLLTLAKDKVVNSRIVSIYGLFDPHIPGGSNLDGAKNILLPTYGHFRIMKNLLVHSALLESIRSL